MISLAFSSQAKELIFIDQLTADVKICCQVNRTLTHHYKLIIHLWVFKLKSGNFISFTYADLLGSLFQRGWGTLSLSPSHSLIFFSFFFGNFLQEVMVSCLRLDGFLIAVFFQIQIQQPEQLVTDKYTSDIPILFFKYSSIFCLILFH